MAIASVISLLILFSGLLQGQVLFEDRFDSGKSNQWRQKNDGSRPAQFRVYNGRYHIISPHSITSLPRALVSSTTDSYFILADVTLRPLDPHYSSASLLSHYVDSNHFYEFSIHPQIGYWSLHKYDKMGNSLLARGNIPRLGNRYRIGLYANSGDIRAFINGIMVTRQSDPSPLSAGSFGLSCRGAETQWDNVLVKVANPDEFFYAFTSKTTSSSGQAVFGQVRFLVTDSKNSPLKGIRIYQIQKERMAYYIFQDPAGRFRIRSGFAENFPVENKKRKIILQTKTVLGEHGYDRLQMEWLLSFLKRSARFSFEEPMSADLQVRHKLHFRSGQFYDGNQPLTDNDLGIPGEPVEIIGMLFGAWDLAGNYNQFPFVSSTIENNFRLISLMADSIRVPENTRFNQFRLRLNSGGQSLWINWFVQDDSRGHLYVENAGFPAQIQAGGEYTIPCTLVNRGEATGPFILSIRLSTDSTMAVADTNLGEIRYPFLEADARVDLQITIRVPTGVSAGRYFIGTFLQSVNRNLRTFRIQNATAIRAVTVGDIPGPGDLVITLSWWQPADLDLHVTDPYGEKIYYFHPSSMTEASLSKDQECFSEGSRTERLSYPGGRAPSGTYLISIHYFRACDPGTGSVEWRIEVNSDRGRQTYQGTIKPGAYLRAGEFVR